MNTTKYRNLRIEKKNSQRKKTYAGTGHLFIKLCSLVLLAAFLTGGVRISVFAEESSMQNVPIDIQIHMPDNIVDSDWQLYKAEDAPVTVKFVIWDELEGIGTIYYRILADGEEEQRKVIFYEPTEAQTQSPEVNAYEQALVEASDCWNIDQTDGARIIGASYIREVCAEQKLVIELGFADLKGHYYSRRQDYFIVPETVQEPSAPDEPEDIAAEIPEETSANEQEELSAEDAPLDISQEPSAPDEPEDIAAEISEETAADSGEDAQEKEFEPWGEEFETYGAEAEAYGEEFETCTEEPETYEEEFETYGAESEIYEKEFETYGEEQETEPVEGLLEDPEEYATEPVILPVTVEVVPTVYTDTSLYPQETGMEPEYLEDPARYTDPIPASYPEPEDPGIYDMPEGITGAQEWWNAVDYYTAGMQYYEEQEAQSAALFTEPPALNDPEEPETTQEQSTQTTPETKADPEQKDVNSREDGEDKTAGSKESSEKTAGLKDSDEKPAGSVYDLSRIRDVNGKYLKQIDDVIVYEENRDKLLEDTACVTVSRNGEIYDLERDVDYSVEQVGSSAMKKIYKYRIFSDVFQQDGVYQVYLSSQDQSGHQNRNEDRDAGICFGIDRTDPLIISLAGSETADTEGRREVKVRDDMQLSDVSIYAGDQKLSYETEGDTYRFTVPEVHKDNEIRVVARDAAGNTYERMLPTRVMAAPAGLKESAAPVTLLAGLFVGVLGIAGYLVIRKKKARRSPQ